jgi:hypothetical protein
VTKQLIQSPFGKAVRGRFLNVFGLEAHDYWISATEDNNPLYPIRVKLRL